MKYATGYLAGSVTSDSDIDVTANIGTNSSDYNNVNLLDSVYQNITEINIGNNNSEYSSGTIQTIKVEVASDNDDDYWNYDSGWTHVDNNAEIKTWNSELETGISYGQVRFALNIPQNSTIFMATLYMYEINDGAEGDAWIYRINETNVGSLEGDASIPEITYDNWSYWDFDNSGFEWEEADVTKLVQDQVNLVDWQANYYIGLRLNISVKETGAGSCGFEDYQRNPETNHSYINITYQSSVGWLDEWNYRKPVYIPVRDGATSDNYTIPLDIYYGDGSDHNFTVYTDGLSEFDFADIRFTLYDGETELRYWLEETIGSYSTDWFTNDSTDLAFYPANYPAAYYYNGRTYISFQGDLENKTSELNTTIWITYYDHSLGEWSGIFFVGFNPLDTLYGAHDPDDHGSPVIWVDLSGYIHVIMGAHVSPPKHYISEFSEDISSFIMQEDITGSEVSYVHANYDNVSDVVHVTYRRNNNPSEPGGETPVVYQNSTDNGVTWSSPQVIFNVSGDGGLDCLYHGIYGYYDGKLHLGFAYWDDSLSEVRDIYYAYLDVSTGDVYNASDDNLGSFVTMAEWSSVLVHDSGDRIIQQPAIRVDANNDPYLIFIEENTTDSDDFTVRFIYWTGSAWSSIYNITTSDEEGGSYDMIVYASDNITAFCTNTDDMGRFTWDGASWTFEENLRTTNGLLSWPIVPNPYYFGFHPELQVAFTEYVWEADVKKEAFAWGSNGLLTREISKHVRVWVEVTDNLSQNGTAIYFYYGNPAVSSTSTSLDVNNSVTLQWGNEEISLESYHLSWEHQVNSVPVDGSDYNITIYGKVSVGENISIQLWNATSSAWVDSNVNMNTTLTWYNFSLIGFSGVLDTEVTWRYLPDDISPDSLAHLLTIDYAGLEYEENGGETTTTTITTTTTTTTSLLPHDGGGDGDSPNGVSGSGEIDEGLIILVFLIVDTVLIVSAVYVRRRRNR